MKISTVIPTYRRPKDLKRCLEAMENQTRVSDETIVVVRDTDFETWTLLNNSKSNFSSLKILKVTLPGVVAAMNLGLQESKGDIIAFTDDDAAPHPDWLEKIEQYFLQDESIGSVGGKDWQYYGNEKLESSREIVGQLQWFGRFIGNHHLGYGKTREVDVLKGVNMSFRRSAIKEMRFDERMKGAGAQVHFELAFCLALKKLGWKLIYDPEVAVDHYPALRFDEDKRGKFNDRAFFNSVHNETLILLEHLPLAKRIAFILWINLIGSRKNFGLLQLLRFLPKEKGIALQKWLASVKGRYQAQLTWQNSLKKLDNQRSNFVSKPE